MANVWQATSQIRPLVVPLSIASVGKGRFHSQSAFYTKKNAAGLWANRYGLASRFADLLFGGKIDEYAITGHRCFILKGAVGQVIMHINISVVIIDHSISIP